MSAEYTDIIAELGIEDSDYRVVDPEDSALTELESPIHEIEIVKDNEWKGLRVRYGRVSISPEGDPETGEAVMSFDYELTNVDEPTGSDLEHSDEFSDFLGRILHHIIIKSFETGDYRIGGKDSDDSNDDPA